MLLRIGDHALGKYAHDHHGQSDDGKRRKHQAENRYKQQQPIHVRTFIGVKYVISDDIVRIVRSVAIAIEKNHIQWQRFRG